MPGSCWPFATKQQRNVDCGESKNACATSEVPSASDGPILESVAELLAGRLSANLSEYLDGVGLPPRVSSAPR